VSIPYASATTGTKAREEISKVLRRFGCESIGFMEEEQPWSYSRRSTKHAMSRRR